MTRTDKLIAAGAIGLLGLFIGLGVVKRPVKAYKLFLFAQDDVADIHARAVSVDGGCLALYDNSTYLFKGEPYGLICAPVGIREE